MKKLIITVVIIFSSIVSNAQNADLKYLDDGGYSQISNYVSLDIAGLFYSSIEIRYEHVFGKHFILSGGIILMNPNKKHVFKLDPMNVYEQDKRDFYPKAPGINLFAEAKSRIEFNSYTSVYMGLGYGFYRYNVAFMQDFYATTGILHKIGMSTFIIGGIEFGLRRIKYSDIEYNPKNATGFLLELYNEYHEEKIKKLAIIFSANLGVGYMF